MNDRNPFRGDRVSEAYEGMKRETMSHPPETSRELAERIVTYTDIHGYAPRQSKLKDVTALIEAWVRVRETEAQLRQHLSDCRNKMGGICPIFDRLTIEIDVARKQLGEEV